MLIYFQNFFLFSLFSGKSRTVVPFLPSHTFLLFCFRRVILSRHLPFPSSTNPFSCPWGEGKGREGRLDTETLSLAARGGEQHALLGLNEPNFAPLPASFCAKVGDAPFALSRHVTRLHISLLLRENRHSFCKVACLRSFPSHYAQTLSLFSNSSFLFPSSHVLICPQ